MRKLLNFTLFLLLTLIFTSCGKEKLTPQVAPLTINELRNDQPVNFSYKVNSTKIDEFGKNTGKFPVFGKLFQSIAVIIANSQISSKEGHELEIAPVDIDISTLSDVDFKFIDWIRLDSLLALIDNAKKKDSLEFVDKFEIFAILEKPLKDTPPNEKGLTRLVYFDKKIQKIECEGRCLNLKIEKINWKELLRNNSKIKLLPKIIINSVPKSTMSIAGSVSFSVKFNVGF